MGFGMINGFIDHLYTHHSELQAVTVPLLFSTTQKSPQHSLTSFQPAVSSPAVPWQRLLIMEILQLPALRSSLHSFPCRTQLSTEIVPTVLLITSRHGSHRKHSPSIVACVLVAAGTCLPSRCLETVAVYSLYLAVIA
jgi:hypothetical protein